MNDTDDDRALVAAVADGSALAFNRLVDRHQAAVRTFLRGVAKGMEDADDLAQETFLTAWRNARSYRSEGAVRAWLFSIAWRHALDSHRRISRGRKRDTAWLELESDTQSGSEVEDILALRRALDTLTPDQKAAVMLCLGCGLSHPEAAEALRLPLGTIKSHVLRGRERLQRYFGELS